MTPLRVSVEVPASPEAVYRFIADEYAVNHSRWDEGIVGVDLDEPVRPGACGREVRRFLGIRGTTHFEVLTAVRPSRLVLRDEPGVWELIRTYEISPLEPVGARVTLVFDMRPRALWFRLVDPLLRPAMQRQVRATVARLGQLLGDADPR